MNSWSAAYYTQGKKKHEHPQFHEVLKEAFGDNKPPEVTEKGISGDDLDALIYGEGVGE